MLQVPSAGWASRILALSSDVDDPMTAVHAARLRVLRAGAHEVEPSIERCARLPREASLDLLGWLGSALALEPLRSALEDGDPAIRERAAWSLARITGAGRDELGTIEVDEHGHPVPDPDGEDPPPEGFDPTRRHPPTEPSFWAEPIARARSLNTPRLRFGRPLDVASVLDELLDPMTHQGVRRVLVTELALRADGRTSGLGGALPSLPLDVDDWIARQERVLALAREALSPAAPALSPPPGGRR